MQKRWLVLAVVIGLVAAGCGSRTNSSSKSTTTSASGGSGTTAAPSTGPTDASAPCGPGSATGATAKGVTNSAVTIGTYQDIGGPRPGLFAGNQQAMDAFLAYCNSLGGVNGRKLVLDKYDSALTLVQQQVQTACDNDFAIVGEAAALDGAAGPAEDQCQIPDVAAFTAENAHRAAKMVVQPLPNPVGHIAVGTERYLARTQPDKVKHAAMLYVNVSVGPPTAKARVEGYSKVGWNFVYQQPIDITELNWGPKIQAFRDKNVGVFEIVSDLTNLVNGLKEIRNQGLTGVLSLSDQSAYDQAFLQQAGPAADGTYVEDTTVPFAEANTSNEMQLFLYWLNKTHPGATPTALGVQSFSAGLLFATALKSLGSNVTRPALLDALHGIHSWDGRGLHANADPGANLPSPCFITLQVKNQKFTRAYPSKGFSCDPKNVVAVSGT